MIRADFWAGLLDKFAEVFAEAGLGALVNRLALLCPLIKGTCPAAHLTRRSIAPTTST
jgi:hypothetical protein